MPGIEADQLWVSERFVSLQGEGATAGVPSAFLRLGQCNLSCSWCDTPYTWDFEKFDRKQELQTVSFDALVAWLLPLNIRRLIITGGEPLVQHRKLMPFLHLLDQACLKENTDLFVIEVETNGTILSGSELSARVNQWNISPKLCSSGQSEKAALKPEVLAQYRVMDRAFLKFVLSDSADEQRALRLIAQLSWPKERVIFMPEARDKQSLRERSPRVAQIALREGVLFSSRLHLELYDGRRAT